ncbi:MAG: ADP-ribosylglycohydrolase family protein [Spirochaetota bacterium]
MLGAIAGDIIGSIYEGSPIKTKDFPLFSPSCTFTDDSVLTVAIAHAILNDIPYDMTLRDFYRSHPHAGYGGMFQRWAVDERMGPYNSWGNGSAMRVSPVGYAFDTLEEVITEAELTAAVTHHHPEGIRGAQATAACVFTARGSQDKSQIRDMVTGRFGYDLSMTLEDIRPSYGFDVSCQGTVPPAIIAFLESTDYEDAVRNAVSLGGDSDTLACITGGIAEAFYGGIPGDIEKRALELLTDDLRKVTIAFRQQYC